MYFGAFIYFTDLESCRKLQDTRRGAAGEMAPRSYSVLLQWMRNDIEKERSNQPLLFYFRLTIVLNAECMNMHVLLPITFVM